MLIGAVRRFIRSEVVPLEVELDQDAYELPPEDKARLVEIVKEMGLYLIDVPTEYGGPGLDAVTRTLVAEETAQHRAGLYAPAYGVFGPGGGLAQLYSASEEQKANYLLPMLAGHKRGCFALTEPSGGSDPARSIQTSARMNGDSWVLNGSKIFISNADTADFALVFARTDKEKGRDGITCFIVDTDTPGFEVRRIVHTLRTSHPATEISLDDVHVPNLNVLGDVGGGFALADSMLTLFRITYAAGCVGVAAAAHRMATDYCTQRVTFGEPLSQRQAIQWMLVDNEIDIRTSRWLCLAAASKADAGEPFRFETAMAKLHATEAASQVVDRAMQIHGGYGVSRDLPLERWWRELRIRRIGDGPSEVQRIIMARDLTSKRVPAGAIPQ